MVWHETSLKTEDTERFTKETSPQPSQGVNAPTNPGLGRRLGSAAFHDTLVEVERLVVREGE